MSVMVDDPTTYFSQWIARRSSLLQKLETEAAAKDIPIVGPVVGRLLYLLARLCSARQILELGTATGYSALFLAQACRRIQGRVISYEIDPLMAERARANIAQAGMNDVIEVRCQDARQATAAIEGPVDMVFMDVEKQDYVTLLPACAGILRSNGLLVADNTGFMDAHEFNRAIHDDPGWISVNLWALLPGHSPEQDGICLAVKA
jgi:predicted O-methyltransferase YrrM